MKKTEITEIAAVLSLLFIMFIVIGAVLYQLAMYMIG